jgi:hypothetical protein
MSMQAGLKAGGIGAAVMIVLALLGMIPIPFLGCLCCLVVFAAWIGAGVLAANFSPAPRTAGGAASTGALAGVVSGLGYGLVTTIAAIVRAAMGTGAAAVSSMLTPDMLQQLQQAGVDPQTFSQITSFMASTGGAAIVGSLCCLGALVLGAVLGALGGAIGAAMFKN